LPILKRLNVRVTAINVGRKSPKVGGHGGN